MRPAATPAVTTGAGADANTADVVAVLEAICDVKDGVTIGDGMRAVGELLEELLEGPSGPSSGPL